MSQTTLLDQTTGAAVDVPALTSMVVLSHSFVYSGSATTFARRWASVPGWMSSFVGLISSVQFFCSTLVPSRIKGCFDFKSARDG